MGKSREIYGHFMDIYGNQLCVEDYHWLSQSVFFFATPLLLLQFDQVFCLNIPALV